MKQYTFFGSIPVSEICRAMRERRSLSLKINDCLWELGKIGVQINLIEVPRNLGIRKIGGNVIAARSIGTKINFLPTKFVAYLSQSDAFISGSIKLFQ